MTVPVCAAGGESSGGRFVLLLLNRLNTTASITARWEHMGLDAATTMDVRDVMQRSDLGLVTAGGITRSVGAHDVAVFTLTPQRY